MHKALIQDVTEEWKKNARPKDGEIEISDYTIVKSGERFDENNSKLKKVTSKDMMIGTWFKNTIWGDTLLQRGNDYPQGKPSADLLLLNDCPFIEEQTIEIKTIPNTTRIDGVTTAIKSGEKQSGNILLDISGSNLTENTVIKEVLSNMGEHVWIKTVIIKNQEKLIAVYSR